MKSLCVFRPYLMLTVTATLFIFAGISWSVGSDSVACILTLAVSDTSEALPADVVLHPETSGGTLTLTLPGDEPCTARYMLVEPDHIKFQVTRFANDKLAALQFMGTGNLREGFNGIFRGFVDGEPRQDMSGKFTLKIRE